MLIYPAGAIFIAVPPRCSAELPAGAAGNPRRLQRFQRPAGGSFSTRFAF